METWFQGRLGFPVRLPSVARRLIGGRVSSVADAPVAYALYDRSSQSISLFVTRRVPFARRGWTERHVDGAELYFASLRGVARTGSTRPCRPATRRRSSSSRSCVSREGNLGTSARHFLLDSPPDHSRLQARAAVAHTSLELRDQVLGPADLGPWRLRGAPHVLV